MFLLVAGEPFTTTAVAAAARYASPAGSGSSCSEASPCSLPTAIGGAGSGDDIYAFADRGDFPLSSGINTSLSVPIHVHGLNGRARLIFSNGGLRLLAGTADGLYVEGHSGSTTFALDSAAASADRVFVKAAADGHACYMDGATLTNSVCVAGTSSDLALETDGSVVVRNGTLVGGTDAAILSFGRDDCSCSTVTDTFVNVIARSSASGFDLVAVSDNGVTVNMNLTYSNYATTSMTGPGAPALTHINGDATDQTASPAFVNAATDDLHEAHGSPTIDAGVNDAANGSTDLDGDPRSLRGTTDIGADEFVPLTFVLSVSKDGVGGGTVTSSPTGIDCGAICQSSFDEGTQVTLDATPDAHSTFAGWSACAGTGSCIVTMDAAKQVTATFSLLMHTLTVKKKGKGKVTSSPAGVSCGVDCSQSYVEGTKIILTKKPSKGWHFVKWTGACTGKHGCAVRLDADRTVRAVFAKNP